MSNLNSSQIFDLIKQYHKLYNHVIDSLEIDETSPLYEENEAKFVVCDDIKNKIGELSKLQASLVLSEAKAKMAAGLYKGSLKY